MQLINIDIWQLLEISEKKKIVCFGAGRNLKNFIEDFKGLHIQNKIFCILDNDKNKNELVINFGGKLLKIYSFEQFRHMNIDEYIILITSTYVSEIVEQLNSYKQFENIQCCYSNFIRSLTNEVEETKRYYPKDLKIYDTPRIPKKIHYCWFGGSEIPENNRIWMESWKRYCPDYEIIEWNERNYDVTKNQYMYEAYKAKKWGFVSDYARLDIIYNYGGIYLDTDVEIIRNLDELLYQDAFAGVESSRQINTGLGFGSVPHFHIIKDLLESYDDMTFDLNNMVACPTLNEEVFKKYNFVKNGNYQRLDGMTIYPEKVLSGKNAFTRIVEITEHTFAIHHYDGSWGTEGMKNRYKEIVMLYQKFNQEG